MRCVFVPAVRQAVDIRPRETLSPQDLLERTLAGGASPQAGVSSPGPLCLPEGLLSRAALSPRGAVKALFFPGSDVVSWESLQNMQWVSSSLCLAVWSEPCCWSLPALNPVGIWDIEPKDVPDRAPLPSFLLVADLLDTSEELYFKLC